MKEFKYPALNYNAQINQSNDCSCLKYSNRSRKNLKCKLYSLDTLLSSFERFAFEILLHIKFHLWLRFLLRKDIKLQFEIVLTFAAATKRKYPNNELHYIRQTSKARVSCQAKDVVCILTQSGANGLSFPQGTNCTIRYCKYVTFC